MQVRYLLLALFLSLGIPFSNAQKSDNEMSAVYIELLGKGFISGNVDLPIGPKSRITLGLTLLDHEFEKDEDEENYPTLTLPTPSFMYLQLFGQERHYFEAGLGFSLSPVPWRVYSDNDSPLSLHGCLGYRYQGPDRFFFRAGLTPFYRVNWAFLPLVGVSGGYCW
jgi:hypothetical protein